MHVEQIILPMSLEEIEVHRAPYMCDKQAFGFKGKTFIFTGKVYSYVRVAE